MSFCPIMQVKEGDFEGLSENFDQIEKIYLTGNTSCAKLTEICERESDMNNFSQRNGIMMMGMSMRMNDMRLFPMCSFPEL